MCETAREINMTMERLSEGKLFGEGKFLKIHTHALDASHSHVVSLFERIQATGKKSFLKEMNNTHTHIE